MAAVVTYNSLVADVQSYVKRTDETFISLIPLFIMLAQRRIAHDLKILGTKVFITGNLMAGQQTIQKPTRWLNNSTFNIGTSTSFNTRVEVLERPYDFVRIYWPDPTQVAQPKYYSDYDFYHWLIGPTPDLAYPYEIAYYQTPQLIDENVSTNWLTINAPNILLYGTLLETAPYLEDDNRVPMWEAKYQEAKASLSKEDMARVYDDYSKGAQ